MTVGVVIPNVPGRSREVELALASHKVPGVFCHVVFGHATCGEAWNAGAAFLRDAVADLEYIMFTADDLIAHSGWLEAALQVCRNGGVPAPVLYNDDMTVWQPDGGHDDMVAFSRVPFMPMHLYNLLPPCPPIHYYSDCWYGDRLREHGVPTLIHEEYAFTHTWAQVGRHESDMGDRALYEKDAHDNPYRDLETRSQR
jgi:hypothetical protein